MMETSQTAMLTLQKLRSAGQQTVVVQHVNVSADQALIAGNVSNNIRHKRSFTGRGDDR